MDDRARGHRWIHTIWVGPLVTFAGTVTYFQVFARYPTLRDFPWVNLPVVIAGVVLAIVGFVHVVTRRRGVWPRLAGSLGLALSLLAGAFLPLYVFGISYALPGATATSLGLATAPDFELPDSGGALHRLRDYRGSRVVIVFYRGHW